MRAGFSLAGLAGAALVAMPAAAQNVDEMSLSDAAHYCRTAEVVQLLDRGVDINSRNSGGYTPLLMAVTYGCRDVTRLLIERGADLTAKSDGGFELVQLARLSGDRQILAMVEAAVAGKTRAAAPPVPAPAPAPEPQPAAAQPPAAGPAAAVTDARGWPRLGAYAPGRPILYSGTAGKTWDRGVVRSIDPQYGYNIEGVTGSVDAYFVVDPQREPFWTGWFVGDWRISVPMAMGIVTDGRNLYRTVTGGMRLPPLRINADGTYSWRVQQGQGEKLVQGRWEPNPSGPGVILKAAEKGADWLVYNNSRTGSTLGETIILASDCCTYQDGSRLK